MLAVFNDVSVDRRGKYLASNATPLYCSEVLMQSIANSIKDCCESKPDEKPDEAILRFKIGRDYVKVLDYMMSMMETEVYPAVKRLHLLVYPEDAKQVEKEVTE